MIAFSATEPVVLISAGLRHEVGNNQEQIATVVCQSPVELGQFTREHGAWEKAIPFSGSTPQIYGLAANLSQAPAQKRGPQLGSSQLAP